MNRQEFDRLKVQMEALRTLWGDAMGLDGLMEMAYNECFSEEAVDYPAFEDGDTGPTQEYGGAELEAGIFNFVMHLVQTRAQTSNPYAGRAQVAAWLEEVAAGLKQFTTPEE